MDARRAQMLRMLPLKKQSAKSDHIGEDEEILRTA
jgi:hypothetical protein